MISCGECACLTYNLHPKRHAELVSPSQFGLKILKQVQDNALVGGCSKNQVNDFMRGMHMPYIQTTFVTSCQAESNHDNLFYCSSIKVSTQ